MTNFFVIITALIALISVTVSYVYHFYYELNFSLSNDPAVWGQLGDYIGGILNPLLSFVSIVLLIKSLTLQNQANKDLKDEIENTKRTEKIRAFESQLFNMIDSQRQAFESFNIQIKNGKKTQKIISSEAVVHIEDEIERLRDEGGDNAHIKSFIESIDTSDEIYKAIRIFYIMIKMISEKLSDSEGFSRKDRTSHILTLINFTDFSLLRLILIGMQFFDLPPARYLINSNEFNETLKEVGLECGLY